jgi:hypothetical protein
LFAAVWTWEKREAINLVMQPNATRMQAVPGSIILVSGGVVNSHFLHVIAQQK